MKSKKILSILLTFVLVLTSMQAVFAYTGEVHTGSATFKKWTGVNESTGSDGALTLYAQTESSGDGSYARAAVEFKGTFVPGSAVNTVSFDVTPINPISSTSKLAVYGRGEVYEEKTDTQMPKLYFDRGLLEAGKPNKITVVYTKTSAEDILVKMILYVNGYKEAEITATQAMINCGDLIFYDSAKPSMEAEYGFTVGNPVIKMYPYDATLAEVKAEQGLKDEKIKVNTMVPVAEWGGSAPVVQADGSTAVSTDGTDSESSGIRTNFTHGLTGEKYAVLSFDVTPSVDCTPTIVHYNQTAGLSDGTDLGRKILSLTTKFYKDVKTKVDIVFCTKNEETNTQSILVYVNGIYAGKLYDVPAAAGVSVENWGAILFQSGVSGVTTPHSVTYSNVKTTTYTSDTTFEDVLKDVAQGGGEVVLSGVPTISNRGHNTVKGSNGSYTIEKTSLGQSQTSVYIKNDYVDDETFGTGSFIVTKFRVKTLYDAPVTSVNITANGNGTRSAFSYGQGSEVYYTAITDLKNKKQYAFADNIESTVVVSYTGALSDVTFYFNVNATDKDFVGDMCIIDNMSYEVYSSAASLASLKANVVDGYLRKTSIGALKEGATANPDGTFTFVNPSADKLTNTSRFNIQVPLLEKTADYPIDANFVHFHYDVTPLKVSAAKAKFVSSHNIKDHVNMQSPLYSMNDLTKVYSVDTIFDRVNGKDYVFVDGIKVAEGPTGARVACASYVVYDAENNVEQGANSVKFSDCYVDYYYDNNEEITTFDALLDKIFPEGTEKIGYNFIDKATYSEGKYTFDKEIFGFDGGSMNGTLAAYDADGRVLCLKDLVGYSGEEVLETGKEAASIKLFIWEQDNLKPVTKATSVTISK